MIDVITEAILIAVLALVVAYFCYLAFIYFVDNIEDDTDMDFYDSMELSKLPIIKMHSNGQVITFLLDTGADCSFLDKQSAEKFIISPAGTTNPIMGITSAEDDEYTNESCCMLEFNFNSNLFHHKFVLFDLKYMRSEIEKCTDGKIHLDGILGADFLSDNGYVIDFAKSMAYFKK